MIDEFVAALRRFIPDDARLLLCQFRGDPNADSRGKWRASVLNHIEQIDEFANVYFPVSAMRKNIRGEYRRRRANFAGGLLLMIDDVGTGAGSKFPVSLLDPLPPTAMIETSPDNFQATYLFDRLQDNEADFDALIRGFIAKQFLGKDTGQAGVNRVFRPPIGVNGKPKYGGWRVQMREWRPERRYSPEAIAAAFGIALVRENRPPRNAHINKADVIRHFIHVRGALRGAGMLKRDRSDVAGWTDITCPWTDHHTDRADTGAALREPDEENGWTGAFRCHHGHCEGKGWRELTEWLAEAQAEVLEAINRNG